MVSNDQRRGNKRTVVLPLSSKEKVDKMLRERYRLRELSDGDRKMFVNERMLKEDKEIYSRAKWPFGENLLERFQIRQGNVLIFVIR